MDYLLGRSLVVSLDSFPMVARSGRHYEFAEWKKARVNIGYHIEIDHNCYSVPHILMRKEVEV